MTTVLEEPADLLKLVGQQIGTTEWMKVTQQQVDQFAEATGDHQWIHTDPGRAAKGPFKGTIAHGYLTLSLAPVVISQVLQIREKHAIYMADSGRFNVVGMSDAQIDRFISAVVETLEG